ncbi:MAG: immunoglobulin-like domain-containing protein, partial [Fidelibacterota bacterium]
AGGNSIDLGSWGNATDGSWLIDLVGTGDYATPGAVEQTISTDVGADYVLSFDIIVNGVPSLVATIDGASQTFSTTGSHSVAFTATATTTTINLSSDGSYQYVGNNLFLDNVSVSGGEINSASFTTGILPAGSYTYTLTVSDGEFTSSDEVVVTVEADVTAPVITVDGNNPLVMFRVPTYTDPGATATDDCDLNPSLTVNSTVDPTALGSYAVTYTATDAAGNSSTATRVVQVVNRDPIAVAGNAQTFDCVLTTADVSLDGSGSSDPDNDQLSYSWSEGGTALATGAMAQVSLGVGVHTLTLTVDDGFGGTASADVVITVNGDVEPPVLTLVGDNPMQTICHYGYTDPGVDVVDVCDAAPAVTVSSTVDTLALGTYEVTYTATDAAGNSASVTRTVEVINNDPVVANAVGTVTLTFGGSISADVDLSTVFTDPDGHPMTFAAVGGDDGVATASLNGSVVTVDAVDFGYATVTVTATDICGGSTVHEFTVEVIALPALAQSIVFATHESKLGKESEVVTGNVIVNDYRASEDDDDHGDDDHGDDEDDDHGDDDEEGYELKLDKEVLTPAGYFLHANSIQIKKDAVVAGDIYYNVLDASNNADLTGALIAGIAVPEYVNMPPFKSAPAGNSNVTVQKNQTLTLPPGDYGRIKVKKNGKLHLTGGVYNVAKLELEKKAKLRFENAGEVRVADKLKVKENVYIGPANGAMIDASSIIFYVAGDDEIELGKKSHTYATIYAPDAELEVKEESDVTGALYASEVKVEKEVLLTLDSYFDVLGNANAKLAAWSEPIYAADIPETYSLSQNYPNPFNPTTNIDYALTEDGFVNVKVYDILGREVATLVNGMQLAGHHTVRFDAGNLAAGTYIYLIQTDGFRQAKKMVLLK